MKAQRSFLKIAKNKKKLFNFGLSKNDTQVEKIIQEKNKTKIKVLMENIHITDNKKDL